jgi:ribosome maturation factor RimP
LAHSSLPPLENLATLIANPMGFEINSVALHSHRNPQALVIALGRTNGTDISLEDCASFSCAFSDALEAEPLLSEAYVLEVTSPGVGNVLLDDRDFRSFRGFPVSVLHRDKAGVETSREGSLLGRDDDAVEINLRGRVVRIPRPEVFEVRLANPKLES